MKKLLKLINYRSAAFALFAGLFVLILATFRDYGIAWDEPLRHNYGRYLIAHYSGVAPDGEDQKAVESTNLYLYGGAFDIPASLLSRLINQLRPVGEFEAWHLVTALVGLLGILGCWAVTRLLAGDGAAFWAALLLSVTPVYSGQIFFNPKDIPFAAGYIWALFFLLRGLSSPARPSWPYSLAFGLAAGLTMGIRAGGLILFGYLLVGLVWQYAADRAARPAQPAGASRLMLFFKQVVLPFGLAFLVAYALMLAAWPWGSAAPLRNVWAALGEQSRFQYGETVLYGGVYYPAGALPGSYIFGYLAVVLPELLLGLLLAGLAIGAAAAWRGFKQQHIRWLADPHVAGAGLLVLATLLPVAIALIGRSVLYDGIRHLLFIVPLLASFGGMSLAWLLGRLAAGRVGWSIAAVAVLVVYLAWHASTLVRLHPYEYIYYNRLAGGASGAAQRYETDYWGTAFSEAARWLAAELKTQAGLSAADRYRVFVACANDTSAAYYFPTGLNITHDPAAADFFIGGIRWACLERLPGKILFSVERFGVPLAVVKEP